VKSTAYLLYGWSQTGKLETKIDELLNFTLIATDFPSVLMWVINWGFTCLC